MTIDLNDVFVGPVQPANGVTQISVDFYVEDETWLEVYKGEAETLLVLGVDYTFTGELTSTGFITLTVPADGVDYYSIWLNTPQERQTDLARRGGFNADIVNRELDRIIAMIQYLNTATSKVLQSVTVSDLLERIVVTPGEFTRYSDDGTKLIGDNDALETLVLGWLTSAITTGPLSQLALLTVSLADARYGEIYGGPYVPNTPGASDQLYALKMPFVASLPADLAGSQVYVQTNPAATFDVAVFRDATQIGTISISTGGVATLTTTGGLAQAFAVGEVLRLVAPVTPDTTIAGLGIALEINRSF